jgi:hypothetical protein
MDRNDIGLLVKGMTPMRSERTSWPPGIPSLQARRDGRLEAVQLVGQAFEDIAK